MPDRKVTESEVNVKDESGRTSNCVRRSEHDDQVNGAGALDISVKKLKQEVDPAKSHTDVIAEINDIEFMKCSPECIQQASGVTSEGAKLSDESMTSSKIKSNGFAFSRKDSVSQARDLVDNSNSYHFELNNASLAINNLDLLQNDLTYGENDPSFFDWPDIDNFDDVDRLFRKCDSTFGQQQMENTDQLSWLPSSSDDVYSSEAAMQTVTQSPYSEFDVLNDLSEYHSTENKLLSITDASMAVCDNSFSSDYQFNGNLLYAAENKESMNAWSKQAYDEVQMGSLAIDQMGNGSSSIGYGDLDTIGGYYSSANTTGELANHKSVVRSAPKLTSSQNSAKHPLESSSPSYVTSDSYAENNSQVRSTHVSFSHGAPKRKPEQLEKKRVNCNQPIGDPVMVDHPSQQALTGGAGGDQGCRSRYGIKRSEHEEKPLELPKVGSDSSMVLDRSLYSSISSDDSIEESSLWQLQNAISQLDVKTKLCIRDSLYRLARTVRQRQGYSTATNENGESEDAREIHNAETSGQFAEAMDVETETNPIDRSIAMLLFHPPLDSFPGTVDDASSLKSHVTNERSRAAINNSREAMPASLYSDFSPRETNSR